MSDLDHLLYWRGIAGEYLNYRGEMVQVPIKNRLELLQTMGIDVTDAVAVASEAYELDVGPWKHFFPPLQTYGLEQKGAFYINLHPDRLSKELKWQIRGRNDVLLDSGSCMPISAREVGDYSFKGLRYSRRLIPVNISEPGYYELRVEMAEQPEDTAVKLADAENTCVVEAVLALVPKTVFQPDWLEQGANPWGFIVQLYTLRSKHDWGIGDFSVLKLLIEKSAKSGADLIGLNPLHALLPDIEEHCSPYSPSDRRFINPLYIDPTIEPEFTAAVSLHAPAFAKKREDKLSALRKTEYVDYAAVQALKYVHFKDMFQVFWDSERTNDTPRYQAFIHFVEESGYALKQFALYEAVRNRCLEATYHADVDDSVLTADVDSSVFTDAWQSNLETVMFHCYLQWLAHEQLEQCQRATQDAGMRVGLIRDLAVGADGGGSEAFSNPGLFCTGASVGAPPDPLAEQGQNWGLPPMDPAHLRATGFKHFIQVLRENMSRCGALRIDHAMSLMRLWWCPPGTTADHGAYVYYPFEDMLGLLSLESYLNQCAIIGEDLGVVPAEFRKAISAARIFTNRVFYFEKENYSFFKDPKNYDVHALAMVNNHDVPTLKSWWDGTDLLLRDRLNIFEEGVDYQSMKEQRSRDKNEVFNFLEAQQLLPETWEERDLEKPASQDLIYAILCAVSRVSSRLFVLQLEDVLLMEEPVNVPGTHKEHPNWQRKMSGSVEAIFNRDTTQKLLNAINQERQRNQEPV